MLGLVAVVPLLYWLTAFDMKPPVEGSAASMYIIRYTLYIVQ